MIAETKPQRHQHDAHALVIDQHSEAVGRRISLHLAVGDYTRAKRVLDYEEAAHRAPLDPPMRPEDVPIAAFELRDTLVDRLADQHILTLADLIVRPDDALLQIENLGPGTLLKLRRISKKWTDRIAENALAE